MTIPSSSPRRLLSLVGAAVLTLPLNAAAVVPAGAVAPGARAAVVHTVARQPSETYQPYAADRRGYGPAYGYGGQGYGTYGGYDVGSSGAVLDTTTATATQSLGLVDVTTTLDFGTGEAAGTGMVLRSDGIVVTNHHVVAGATAIEVTVVSTGATYAARVLGTDATHDVAVLQLVGATGLTAVDTSVEDVAQADTVTAVGDANGDGGTLTAAPGTVIEPRTHITVTGDDGTTTTLDRLIEVTSDVIPGDSGGALLDAAGDVIGMNVAASEGSTDVTGYAIPIARVLGISGRILRGEASSYVDIGYDGFLGVELADSAAPEIVAVLTNGAAARAGLTAGDVVTSVAGRGTASVARLRRVVSGLDAGDSVEVTWTDAAGGAHSADVTLGRAPVA